MARSGKSYNQNMARLKDHKFLTFALVTVFLIYGLLGIAHHEMWRDELQAWTLARDSVSIPDLLSNLRYEGHPPLWHLLLFPLTRLSADPAAMQLLHVLITTGGIWVFLKFAPFSWPLKALFIFGYFPAYEYLIKSRNYGMGMALLFAFCALYASPQRKYSLLFLVLFLAAQTNFVTAILAICLGGSLLAMPLLFRKPVFFPRPDPAFGMALFACTAALLAFQVRLPPDIFFPVKAGLETTFDMNTIRETVGNLNTAYFARLPENGSRLNLLVSVAELAFFTLLFLRRPAVCLAYVSGTCGLLAFFYISHGNISLRHTGFLFLLLIVCLWLAAVSPARDLRPRRLNKLAMSAEKLGRSAVLVILAGQLIMGVEWYARDWNKKYTSAGQLAEFIRGSSLDGLPIIGHIDYSVSPLAGLLNRKIYYVQGHRWGSFIRWDKARVDEKITPELIFSEAARIGKETGKDVLIVLNVFLDPKILPPEVRHLAVFADSLDPAEKYSVYLAKYTPEPD